jgi:hypothetical protein
LSFLIIEFVLFSSYKVHPDCNIAIDSLTSIICIQNSHGEEGSDEEFEGDYADLPKVKKTQYKRVPDIPESLDYSPSFTLSFTPMEVRIQ